MVKWLIGGIGGLFLIVLSAIVIQHIFKSDETSQKHLDHLYGTVKDVYDTKKDIVQNVNVTAYNNGAVDANTSITTKTQKQNKQVVVTTKKGHKVYKAKAGGNINVNVIANNQDTSAKRKDAFDDTWDNMNKDFNDMKADF